MTAIPGLCIANNSFPSSPEGIAAIQFGSGRRDRSTKLPLDGYSPLHNRYHGKREGKTSLKVRKSSRKGSKTNPEGPGNAASGARVDGEKLKTPRENPQIYDCSQFINLIWLVFQQPSVGVRLALPRFGSWLTAIEQNQGRRVFPRHLGKGKGEGTARHPLFGEARKKTY
jgi:hypothetical protein